MQQFAIGQRWLSDTESELGLGIIIEVSERKITILFPASDETCIYIKESAPITRIIFAVGDTITDQEGLQWQVQKLEQAAGLVKYHCLAASEQDGDEAANTEIKIINETRLSAQVQLSRPLDRLLAGHSETKEWFDLRVESLLMMTKHAVSQLRGLTGPRVGLVPHQLYIAHEVGKRLAPRVLLADEVGLGKTIEAGLIIHQQLISGRSERVLVLVPDSLQYQWMIEMRRRFNLNFAIYDLVRTASIKEHDPDANPFMDAQCIIASRDLLVDHDDLMQAALEAGFDLLVVDEAHHLQWSVEQGGNEHYRMVEQLAAECKGVLLLTATPEQLGMQSHFARLRLLDPNRFNSLDEFLHEEDSYQETVQMADSLLDGAPMDSAEWAMLLQQLGLPLVEYSPEARQKTLNLLVDRRGTGRVLFRNTREAVKGFMGRICAPIALSKPSTWPSSGNLRAQLWPEELQDDGGWMEQDPRVVWLMQALRSELKYKKVLLIARSGAVVAALDNALRMHAGVRSVVFNEEMSLLERDQAAAYFSEEHNGAQILLCSEIGSEGRNFQFASDLILFDLPANPDTLEQRIGRLDRIGQKNDITIYVPYVMGSAHERLFRWYDEGFNVFNGISPSAQTLHEHYLPELKAYLLGEKTEGFDLLLYNVANQCAQLQAELQQGRDRLLEYNSCRPQVAARIVNALKEQDSNGYLADYISRFMSAINLEYEQQHDGSLIVTPNDDILVDGVELPEDSCTMVFDRDTAIVREDTQYVTLEHPFVASLFDLVKTESFGNNTVCFLRSNAIPVNTVLAEVWFRVQVIAPKQLNLPASFSQQMVRVLLHETGKDLSANIAIGMLDPYVLPMDKTNVRAVVRVKREAITAMYQQAEQTAANKLPELIAAATKRYTERLTAEVERLRYMQAQYGTVRDIEISLLEQHMQQGIQLFAQAKMVPEAVRVLLAVK